MKFSGSRALVVATCVMALFSLTAVANLQTIATNELIPEISTAAGLALAGSYAETKTEAQLEDLAVNGRTIGLRTAGSAALTILYFDKTGEELMAILVSDADAMIRAAAIDPVQMHLITLTGDDEFVLKDYLKDLAETGETAEMRLAAARAYFFVIRKTLPGNLDELQADANGDDEFAIAAGEMLGGYYLFHPALRQTEAELIDQARNAETAGLRVAAGRALVSLLIQSDATADTLNVKLLDIAATGSAEFRAAYMAALAHRFGQ